MSGSGGQSQGGSEMAPFYLLLAVVLFSAVLYHFFKAEIVGTIFYIKYHELKFISIFAPHYASLINWINVTRTGQVQWSDVVYLSKDVGYALQYPVVFISLALGAITYFFHPDSGFNETESMKTLYKKVHPLFPATQIMSGLDLANEDIAKGPWAMALTPVEYGKKYKLLSRNHETGGVVVDIVKAKSVFSKQLGRPWSGIQDLTPYEKGLFAALCAFVNYDRKLGDHLLEQMAASANIQTVNKGGINYAGIDAAIKKHAESPAVQSVVNNHGFVLTVLAAMLETARETGIVQNALYLWLKPVDRNLWYTFNNVGRRAVFTETAGVHAHILAEKSVGFAIKSPMVDSAVTGLQEACDSRIIRDVEGDPKK